MSNGIKYSDATAIKRVAAHKFKLSFAYLFYE